MKKKITLFIGAFVLALSIVSGGTYAAFQADGETATTQISTTSLDISLEGDISQIKFDHLVPGETIKKPLAVKNTQETLLYTRVTIKKYWLTKDGEKDYSQSSQNIKLKYNKTDWLQEFVGEDGEEVVLYYKTPLKNNEQTKNFLEAITIPNTFGNKDQGKTFAMDVQVDAIQAFNGKDAMLSTWGILADIDANGMITEIQR